VLVDAEQAARLPEKFADPVVAPCYQGLLQAAKLDTDGSLPGGVFSAPVRSAIGFDLEDIVTSRGGENWDFGIGTAAALVIDVPAGRRRTVRVAVCFHHEGTVTTGRQAAYLYNRWFQTVEDVAAYAITHFPHLTGRCTRAAAALTAPTSTPTSSSCSTTPSGATSPPPRPSTATARSCGWSTRASTA